MTTFTTQDREEAENANNSTQMELPLNWEESSAPWPFTEDDLLQEGEPEKYED